MQDSRPRYPSPWRPAACDKKRGVVYLQFAQNSTEGKPEIDLYAVTVRGKDAGKFEIVPRDVSHGQVLGTMKYSVRRDALVGFTYDAKRSSVALAQRSCSDRTNFQILGDIPNVTMRNGPISALNDEAGIFYECSSSQLRELGTIPMSILQDAQAHAERMRLVAEIKRIRMTRERVSTCAGAVKYPRVAAGQT